MFKRFPCESGRAIDRVRPNRRREHQQLTGAKQIGGRQKFLIIHTFLQSTPLIIILFVI